MKMRHARKSSIHPSVRPSILINAQMQRNFCFFSSSFSYFDTNEIKRHLGWVAFRFNITHTKIGDWAAGICVHFCQWTTWLHHVDMPKAAALVVVSLSRCCCCRHIASVLALRLQNVIIRILPFSLVFIYYYLFWLMMLEPCDAWCYIGISYCAIGIGSSYFCCRATLLLFFFFVLRSFAAAAAAAVTAAVVVMYSCFVRSVCIFIVVVVAAAVHGIPDRMLMCGRSTVFHHFLSFVNVVHDVRCACVLVSVCEWVAGAFGSLTTKDWLPFRSSRSHTFEHARDTPRDADEQNGIYFFRFFSSSLFPMRVLYILFISFSVCSLAEPRVSLFVS